MKKLISLLHSTIGKFFIFLFAICIVTNAHGQQKDINESVTLKSRIYKATILTFNQKEYSRKFLSNLSDSQLQLSSSPIYFNSNIKNNYTSAYNYQQLKKVIIMRRGAVGRAAGYGALIGLVAGVTTGLIGAESEKNNNPANLLFTPEYITIYFGIVGAVSGALIGVIVGAVAHKTFIIDGNKNKYHSMRDSIFNKLFRHHSSSRNYEPAYTPNI